MCPAATPRPAGSSLVAIAISLVALVVSEWFARRARHPRPRGIDARASTSKSASAISRIAVSFEAPGGVTALFGSSGSGKTSIVNMIAGLLTPDRGRIAFEDTVLFDSQAGIDVPAHRRGIGYVFQEGRLFPHLSVAANLDYGRWMHGHAARCGRDASAWSNSSASAICSSGGRARSPAASASASPSAARC